MNSSTTNGAGGWTSYPPECERINLTNCTIRNYGYSAQGSANPSIQFAKGSRITNLRIADRRFPPPTPFVIFVHPDDLQLTNVVSDTQMNFEGQNLRLLNVSAPLVYFTLTSSGILLAPLAAGTLEDGSAALDQPLTVRSNGVVRVPMFAQAAVHGPDLIVQANPDAVALQVRSLTPTTAAHLMEWQNGLGSPMFAVRTDGFLATGQSDLSGTIGRSCASSQSSTSTATYLATSPFTTTSNWPARGKHALPARAVAPARAGRIPHSHRIARTEGEPP